jgi:8-oxo-dGTP pyrophosphatase MutT (NUDIX family)
MEEALRTYLSQRKKEVIVDKTRTSAAVLVPLYRENGHYHIVFIRRSIKVPTHQGQIAFPGGARHVTDKNMQDTALREAEEEIGLHQADVNVLGELDDQITTTSNFIVTPFVGVIPWPYEFVISEAEVERIFIVPLASLMEKDRRKPEMETLQGKEYPSFAYYYKGKRIWGATARILYKFLEIIKEIEGR